MAQIPGAGENTAAGSFYAFHPHPIGLKQASLPSSSSDWLALSAPAIFVSQRPEENSLQLGPPLQLQGVPSTPIYAEAAVAFLLHYTF